MIRVLICDDQEIVCEGLRAILSTAQGIDVVGVAYNGAQLLEMIPQAHPDVVLMDLKMPVLNGVQTTRALCARHPGVHVLVLTTFDADEWVFDAIRAGASGYLLKDAPRDRLIDAIEDVLSEREIEVLRLLARGLSNAAIAERLVLSEGTIRNYVSAILAKLGVSDRTQAAVLALKHGLVGDDVQ